MLISKYSTSPISINKVDVFVFRAPIQAPVKTSFGTMTDRPSVLVRIGDNEGTYGWGEVWCNFPKCGAEHRARLITDVLAPLVANRPIINPAETWQFLTEKTHILTIQAGEPGPLAQAIAGIDIAIWDLLARKVNKPLYSLFTDKVIEKIPAYASGIHPDFALEAIAGYREIGYRSFKLKVGFDNDSDYRVICQIIDQLKETELLMLDANQGWDLEQASAFLMRISDLPIEWIEEPIPADRPENEWEDLAAKTTIPLAGGENIRGRIKFLQTINAGQISVIQPDACKWGGISECLSVARNALKAGRRYCPHYLGGGIGLVASAHILAAAGGDGLLEVDVNPNPLREYLAIPYPQISDGNFFITDNPGLGVEPDMGISEQYIVATHSFEAKHLHNYNSK